MTPSPAVVQPDQELIREILDELDLEHTLDSEGDIAISTAELTVFFLFGSEGDLFTIRTFYERYYSVDDKPVLVTALNEWNADTMWPKVYTFTQDSGVMRVVGDSQLYIGAGVTREHLTTVVAHWVRSAIKFHRWLTDRLAFETD
ncbi:YbjN domain-containing protein [Microtetraspora sp. AC03309]|uniref:YbjN domain-containing protein n=1 Tax=Microtetraspora sp. AC03309 TaxID=2779376 RepID=UPI001E2AF2D7|nr:YbjN domain-containing protein [Microtetraspora sp. AC03309]MCC5577967.1 YbjN domain-containing protein [Microtetraspora sp. AC03309]